MNYGLLDMFQAGGNAYSKNRPLQQMIPTQYAQGGRPQAIQPPAPEGNKPPWYDPLGVNKTPAMGAAFNPFGEAMKSGSPAPIFDPIGYSAGWYKPDSKAGKVMKKVNDPLKVFGGK